jgi:hypothetical protein
MDKAFGDRRGWIISFAVAIFDAAIGPGRKRDQ